MRKLLCFLAMFLGAFVVKAQDVAVTATAPSVVEVGEAFRLVYSVNAKASSISGVKLDGFSIMGPSTSFSSSSSWVNGKHTSNVDYSYTYIVSADKEGTFTMPVATVTVDGKQYNSNQVSVQVVAASAQSNSGNQQGVTNGAAAQQRATAGQSAAITNESLFTVVEVSKNSLYMGESLLATIKLYVSPQVDLSNLDNVTFPKMEGFLVEEIDPNQNITLTRTNYNGKVYNMAVIRKMLLFPQHTGELVIDPFEIGCIIRERIAGTGDSFFDDFFGNYHERRVMRKSAPVKINVKELPVAGRPAGFSGVVGNITASATLSADSIAANEALTYKITVSGSGNLKLMSAPTLNLPHDFEVYEPKTTRNIAATATGNRGTVTFEYVIIPRYAGEYQIPALKIPYFNSANNRYTTIDIKPFNVKVLKGNTTTIQSTGDVIQSFKKEEVRRVGEDIRYIKSGDLHLRKTGSYYFASIAYLLSLIIPAILFIVGAIIYRRRIAAAADIVRVKNRRANKMAKGRMKLAAKAMNQGAAEQFYQETLNALWGYVSYKLNIDPAELTRDNVSELLTKHQVDEQMINRFIEVLDRCEYARYAPGSNPANAMSEIYNQAISVITDLDKVIR